MPAPTFPIESTKIMLDYKSRYYELDRKWADSIFNYLNTYNWNSSTGPMPDFSYTLPDGSGNFIEYKPSNGEIDVNGTVFSAMNASQKQILFNWERQFIRQGLRVYSETYNI